MLLNVEIPTVNKEIEMIKSDFNKTANAKLKAGEEVKVATESDKKDSSTKQKYLTPPVKPSQATYFFDNNLMLARSCDILSEDLILGNKINIRVNNDSDDSDVVDDNLVDIINSVEQSKVEIAYMCTDYELNGAACCKITRFEEYNEFRLTQIPQQSLQIMKVVDEKIQATPVYLVEQDTGGGDKKLYKILGETYPDDFESYEGTDLGLVWWIGGDNFNDFYRKPKWLQARESMSSQIALKSLDSERINKGFNMNTILFFNKRPTYMPPQELIGSNNEPMDDQSSRYYDQLANMAENVGAKTIANELRTAGLGIAVLYEESHDPITMEVANISDTNYDYLLEKMKLADQEIISAYGIPRERYMINDVKESMNSQKTAAFWEIYNKSLNGRQLVYENGLLDVIEECYDDLKYDLVVDIEVPLSSEIINSKIEVYSALFLKALLTLKQTIILLSKYITDLNMAELDLTNPIYEMRFFNGSPITDYSLDPNEQIEYDNATASFLV